MSDIPVSCESDRLPPFAIRNLISPVDRPGLISITARQYEGTLRSQPDAALYYLDEDDGEVITVGSGLELSQRLDESVPVYPNSSTHATNPLDGSLVHVFDIKRSSSSLAEWRDHEAYSSKYFTPSQPSPRPMSPTRDELEQAFSRPPMSPLGESVRESESLVEKKDVVTTDSVKILRGIDEHLSGLASVLQIAANTLQKAAEKTRESDTTVVEDILQGVKGILTEVGSIGVEVFSEFTKEQPASEVFSPTIKTISETSAATESNSISSIDSLPGKCTSTQSEAEVESISDDDETKWDNVPIFKCACGHSFYNEGALRCHTRLRRTRKCSATKHEDTTSQRLKRESVDELLAAAQAEYESTSSKRSPKVKFVLANESLPRQEETSTGQASFKSTIAEEVRDIDTNKRPMFVPAAPKWHEVDDRITLFPAPAAKSILDDSSEDPDFTARYPPLRSVRRARSTLEPRSYRAEKKPYLYESVLANRSQDFEYGSKEKKPYTWEPIFSGKAFQSDIKRDEKKPNVYESNDESELVPRSQARESKSSLAHYNSAPFDVKPHQSDANQKVLPQSSRKAQVERSSFDASESFYKSLPGAWPDAKPEGESSGAFFNRMTARRDPTQTKTGLHRANTTASSNPASRLTGPFDPGFPYQPSPSGDVSLRYGPQFSKPRRHLSERLRHRHDDTLKEEPRLSSYGEDLSRDMPESSSRNDRYRGGLRHHRSVPQFNPYAPPVRSSNHGLASKMSMDTIGERMQNDTASSYKSHPATRPLDFANAMQTKPAPIRNIVQPQFNYSMPNIPGSLPSPSPPSARSNTDNKHEQCVEQLKMCGFGLDDDLLKDRLYVYAVAADGDVHEAVEMIEQDRRMSRGYIRA